MANYKNKDGKLELIKEKPFKLEKEIQILTENNLELVLGLDFIKSEYSLNNFRIDTLAYDRSTSSFVIIEYKRSKNFSVIDQGYAYLALMINNKADFILEYNECKKSSLKREDVDWSQSKVIFISPSFTTYQREAINFKDLPIELWELKRYENDTVNYSKIIRGEAQESVKTLSRKGDIMESVNKEIKVYTEQEHVEKASPEIVELYGIIKNEIINLDGIEVKPTKKYIAFVSGSNIVDVHIQHLDDPKQLARDVSNIGHWGNGDYQLQIKDDEDIEYIMSLIKQSYKKNRK